MFGFNFRQRKPSSAQTAKERLQILLAHERTSNSGPDFLPLLQRDILEAVRRHMDVDGDAVDIKLERSDDLSSLEINIEMPGTRKAS
ncbi:cell division topological specificity factor MinE [Paracoccus sp. N5]|uniref:cell division topological specificity factor MinE n=1 Tax=Paracoccus sp. N5 TaxID=1101189 RepID=UPI00035C7F20|nr:cell division topological specificity factor MinE [Paracoccus sp. N5]